jgi:hypothetical protein
VKKVVYIPTLLLYYTNMNEDIDIFATSSPVPKRRSRGEDYVNNKDLSVAVIEHAIKVADSKKNGCEPPQPNDYIATSIMKISNGLSRSPNYVNYPYREDMVMDGVIDCVKALKNFDANAVTRGGSPNAFGYFTQICYYAFLRRIAKEKKQLDIKMRMIDNGSIGAFIDMDDDGAHIGENLVEKVRRRNAAFYDTRKETVEESVPKKIVKRAVKPARVGPLSDYIE